MRPLLIPWTVEPASPEPKFKSLNDGGWGAESPLVGAAAAKSELVAAAMTKEVKNEERMVGGPEMNLKGEAGNLRTCERCVAKKLVFVRIL